MISLERNCSRRKMHSASEISTPIYRKIEPPKRFYKKEPTPPQKLWEKQSPPRTQVLMGNLFQMFGNFTGARESYQKAVKTFEDLGNYSVP